eukprot:gene27316-30165_t
MTRDWIVPPLEGEGGQMRGIWSGEGRLTPSRPLLDCRVKADRNNKILRNCMLIHVVNPNTTASMTAKIAAAAREVARPGTDILATQPEMGPVSIEGYYDEAFAIPGMLGRIREADARPVVGHVIACFDDTGLDAARSIATVPVIGIGEAGYHMARLVAGRFSVVTTLARSIPVMEHNLHRYGLASRCGSVRAAGIEVLALEDPASGAEARISAEIEAAT